MSFDFDAIIVGSGPAGISAAFPLVEAGNQVLMIDGGRKASLAPPSQPFLTARATDSHQWRWMVGADFHALRCADAVSPKLRVPIHDYVFAEFQKANRINAKAFVAVGSLAAGGLSNTWGCGVARLVDDEMNGFPFPSSELELSYGAVASRIGLSGRSQDDLTDYFGLDGWAQPPIQLDEVHRFLLKRYEARRRRVIPLGFRLGRSRIAVLSQSHAGRSGCDHSGNCLWGCHRGALYSSHEEVPRLRKHSNFRYRPGLVVERIERRGDGWAVLIKDGERPVVGRRVLLAAGTLATTRLVLAALQLRQPRQLFSCPTAAFILWIPRLLGIHRSDSFALGQLSYTLRLDGGIAAFGSTFGTTGIPVSEFARHVPLGRRHSIDLLRGLLSSCIVGNLFLPGYLSDARVGLVGSDALCVEGVYGRRVPDMMSGAARRLDRCFKVLGAFMLPGSFKVGQPGADIHYSGTLPMRRSPQIGDTDADGEVCGLKGVHVVDGACLPRLSAKSHTLTIMANADRIGRRLASRALSP